MFELGVLHFCFVNFFFIRVAQYVMLETGRVDFRHRKLNFVLLYEFYRFVTYTSTSIHLSRGLQFGLKKEKTSGNINLIVVYFDLSCILLSNIYFLPCSFL
jgi:hypothetical protein